MAGKTKNNLNFASDIDFVLDIYKEKIPGKGEDSYIYSLSNRSLIAGVFDGCGGSGAKKYDTLQNHTGAYIASRAVAGAVKDWFSDGSFDPLELKERIKEYLSICRKVGGASATIKGSLSKEFPTTAALFRIYESSESLYSDCIWAGDSRCYLLNDEGLMQLTEDDIRGLDAMENLTEDGVLTNVVSLSRDFSLHLKQIKISKPGIIFAATDGCFGYFSTPMEFEYLLLDALFSSESIAQWELRIAEILKEIAGDDFTLCGIALGFGKLQKMKSAFKSRYIELKQCYIDGLQEKSQEEKIALWQIYKKNYSKYLKEG